MKKLIFLISILTLVSCGKKSPSDSSSIPNKEVNELKQIDLSGQGFTQTTLNGESQLYFSDEKKGEIKVFLSFGNGCSILEEKLKSHVSVNFSFKEYKYIEKDIIELSNISIAPGFFIGDCSLCNSRENLPLIINDYKKYCYDLLNNKETIRVKVLNINDKKKFFLLDFGNQRL